LTRGVEEHLPANLEVHELHHARSVEHLASDLRALKYADRLEAGPF
jgi:hypothetical protein